MPGLSASIITFSPGTTVKSADVNSNNTALNNAATPSFSSLGLSSGVTSIGGSTTAGGVGVASVIAANNITVTATTQQTVLSLTIPAAGMYRLNAWFRHGVATGAAITAQVNYTDVISSSARTAPLFAHSDAGVSAIFDSTVPGSGTIWYGHPLVFNAAAASSCTFTFQEAGGSPQDQVYAVLERLT